MTTKEQFQAALALLGPNGENWVKNPGFGVTDGKYCVVTACWHVGTGLTKPLNSFLPSPCKWRTTAAYNDDPDTTFEDILALFNRAIEAQNGT